MGGSKLKGVEGKGIEKGEEGEKGRNKEEGNKLRERWKKRSGKKSVQWGRRKKNRKKVGEKIGRKKGGGRKERDREYYMTKRNEGKGLRGVERGVGEGRGNEKKGGRGEEAAGMSQAERRGDRKSLNGMSAHEDEDTSDGGSMGSIRILNAIKAKTEVPKLSMVTGEKIDLSVVLMDDFKVVLGLEFLDKVRAFPMSFANSLCILDGGKTCMARITSAHVGFEVRGTLPSMDSRGRRGQDDVCHSKCTFTKLMSIVLGHKIKDGGLMMDDAKIKAIQDWEPPTKVTELRSIIEDDIVVYSHTLEEHVLHLKQVFQVLRDNELYVKLEKCSFTQDEVEFLGHKIKDGGLMMDDAKIKAIQDWEPPTKKNKAWIWDEECQAAFESLKKTVMKEPVLRLPDVTMPFELHTDASNFDIGGVLMQDGHPILFESRKLNETERKYTVQEKEMMAVVHCLRIWRHYFLPGKANVVADALSRKAEFAAITQAQFFLQDRIKEGLEHDPLAKKIIALAKDRRTRRFWLKRDMLFTKGDRLYVPKWGDLRRAILKECHDSKWAGHPGITRTLALVEGTYYWPSMGDDVETFVRTCLIFQQDKIEQKKSGGLLELWKTRRGVE
ncbi:putative nucleotidyltransferase, ribonuclease H [Tanacetum coccineum]